MHRAYEPRLERPLQVTQNVTTFHLQKVWPRFEFMDTQIFSVSVCVVGLCVCESPPSHLCVFSYAFWGQTCRWILCHSIDRGVSSPGCDTSGDESTFAAEEISCGTLSKQSQPILGNYVDEAGGEKWEMSEERPKWYYTKLNKNSEKVRNNNHIMWFVIFVIEKAFLKM